MKSHFIALPHHLTSLYLIFRRRVLFPRGGGGEATSISPPPICFFLLLNVVVVVVAWPGLPTPAGILVVPFSVRGGLNNPGSLNTTNIILGLFCISCSYFGLNFAEFIKRVWLLFTRLIYFSSSLLSRPVSRAC